MKTRDTQWFDDQHTELASQGQSWGTAEMYQSKLNCLQWCCDDQDIPQTASILDLGCGAGELASLLRESGFLHVDGVDISKAAILQAESANSGNFTVTDFTNPCELKRKYDCIFDTDCFQMIIENPKRRAFLANVKAHLKGGGVFLIGLNSTKEGVDPHIVVEEHIQYFCPSRDEYIGEVCSAGFRVAASRDLPARNTTKCYRWTEIVFK